jgi:hypothetical protein
MPTAKATSKEAKKWRKENQKRYTDDRDFRTLVDAITLFTQGDFAVMRAFAIRAITGELPEKWKDSSLPSWTDKPVTASSMGEYKYYFEGQDLRPGENNTNASYKESGKSLAEAVANAPPFPGPLFRGVRGDYYSRVKNLKPGDSFELLGPSLFSAHYQIARYFRSGVGGKRGRKQYRGGLSVMFEIAPGARALGVSALSPWDQKELLASGRFRVVKVEDADHPEMNYPNPDRLRVLLEPIEDDTAK